MHNGWAHTDVRRVRTLAPRSAPIGAGVVGCGYWGPNLARNLAEVADFDLRGLCDRDPEPLRSLARRHPDVKTYRDFDHMLGDPSIEAVVITTPPETHYPLAMRALQAGKHVLVEKPLATRLCDGRELARAGARVRAGADAGTHVHLQPRRQHRARPDQGGRRRRHPLRHLLAHEPRQIPARRRGVRPRPPRPVDPPVLARAAGRRSRRVGLLRVPPERSRDGLPDAHLRRRDRRQRPALVAGAAEGPPDDRRRSQAHGPVRRHGLRRTGAGV